MVENISDIVTSADRTKKYRARNIKRKNARNAGVELIENSLVAIEGKFFTVYEWDEAQGDYVKTYLGTLD